MTHKLPKSGDASTVQYSTQRMSAYYYPVDMEANRINHVQPTTIFVATKEAQALLKARMKQPGWDASLLTDVTDKALKNLKEKIEALHKKTKA